MQLADGARHAAWCALPSLLHRRAVFWKLTKPSWQAWGCLCVDVTQCGSGLVEGCARFGWPHAGVTTGGGALQASPCVLLGAQTHGMREHVCAMYGGIGLLTARCSHWLRFRPDLRLCGGLLGLWSARA